MRFKASLQYDKGSEGSSIPKTLKKESIAFPCANNNLKDNINAMLKNVVEMPKQWTIVQLTPQFNQDEILESDSDKVYTNPIHISVFKCGESNKMPFCVTASAPIDKIANQTIEICKEMKDIIQNNKLLIGNVQVTREGLFRNYKDKREYQDARDIIMCRLKVNRFFANF